LLEPNSLTRRLVRACGCRPFRVKLLSARYRYAALDEARALGVPNGVRVLVREVQLLCDETPWVYARSLIPVTSLQGPLQRLKRQGSRSLGATLFADRTLRRGPLEIRCVDATEVPLERDGDKRVNVWGRRSVFHVQNQPLLVSEYFLPALFKHQNKSIKV
jgi:chorismate--pyruvate lyase